jgi:O-methyltransferase
MMSWNSAKKAIRQFIRKHPIFRVGYALGQLLTVTPLGDFLKPWKLRRLRQVYHYSMTGYARLASVHDLAMEVEERKIQGAYVECGVWKGGSIGLMALVSKESGSNRKIVLFDSFEGLPEPTEEDGNEAKRYADGRAQGKLEAIDQCVGPLDTVKELFFEKLRIEKEKVDIRKGWFQDTVPGSGPSIGPIALLRLDGDWYDSTKVCLEGLYDNVVQGGYVVLDDYGYWEGCRKASDEFLARKNLKVDLIKVDDSCHFFRKP